MVNTYSDENIDDNSDTENANVIYSYDKNADILYVSIKNFKIMMERNKRSF